MPLSKSEESSMRLKWLGLYPICLALHSHHIVLEVLCFRLTCLAIVLSVWAKESLPQKNQ